MFFKSALTFLAIGALSVNALMTPVARSPAPEPGTQGLEGWMLKYGLPRTNTMKIDPPPTKLIPPPLPKGVNPGTATGSIRFP